jgi:copper chaperone CopZ
MRDITYHVHDVHCGACEASIRKALGQVEGVGEIDIDVPKRRVVVHYDDAKTDVLAIKERIEKAGFDVG